MSYNFWNFGGKSKMVGSLFAPALHHAYISNPVEKTRLENSIYLLTGIILYIVPWSNVRIYR